MTDEHSALIHWSAEHLSAGLPHFTTTIDPAWFVERDLAHDEGWSLSCDFDEPPAIQGNPSRARVRFRVANAPHSRLHTGVTLQLFERATGRYARVEILD
jgi:hypothetical protein